jgi:antitoxin component YwqK of YwqJK toxin-antitoxin module/predicted DCC family thiol-disulfide oxidoreductase YuxK
LRRLLANFSHPATVYYDDNCGICTRTCEAVATWDRFSRLTFIGSSDRAAWQHSIPEGLVEKTIVVFDSQGRMTIKAAGAATIFAALPLPWHIFRIMAWPGLRWISDRAYDAFARNRHRVSSGLKLTACGVPGVADKANRNHEHEGPAWPMPEEGVAVASAAHPDVSRASGRWLCEPVNLLAGVVLLSVLAGNWGENGDPLWQMARGRSRVDVQQSQRGGWRKWAIENPVVHWPAAIQCWNMFSPDAPGFDNWWVADAETADGRHIDLLARRRDEQDKAVLYFDQPRCTDGWRGWPVLESTWGSYLKHALVSEAGDRLPKATIVLGEFCRYLTQQYNAAVPPQARVTKVRLVNVHLLTAPLTQSATFVPPSDPLFGVLQGTYDAASGSFEPRWDFDKESGQLRTTIVCWHPPRADGTTQIKWIGKRIMATPQVRRQMPDYAWYYDGLFRSWHADGKPLSEGTFACGQRIGLWTHWNEDGVRQQGSYRDNQRDGKWTFLSPDGRLAEGTYIGGKQSGEWVRYYAPRELPAAARAAAKDPARAAVFERMQMVDGEHHGPAQSLYPNGAIRSSGMISHNKQTGVWEEFYPSGRLQALGPYQDNFKHGRWMIWYDLGESESTPLAEGEFRQGKRHGRWTEWSLSGAKRTTMFEDGKPK